jgi:Fic family protein
MIRTSSHTTKVRGEIGVPWCSTTSPFVVAGVVHYAIIDVHPFADGNGRVARLLQTCLMMRAGVLPGRMFSFERYYAVDRPAY